MTEGQPFEVGWILSGSLFNEPMRVETVQRNPIIADVFYKTGLIEKWGRGTNRVIEMCVEAGIAPPTFEEITGAAVVTFKVNVRGPQQPADQVVGRLGTASVPSLSQVRPKSVPSDMAAKLLNLAKVA